ncbi:MAG: 3',5'-cyclic-nucleotide phosphodiesterase [Chlamydiales bacterium]
MSFQIVVMGCTGGPKENNISGYLFSPIDRNEWIALDAGTLLSGIERALEKKNLDDSLFSDTSLTPSGEMLSSHLQNYLISHAHLDHIAGLILNSQVDTPKSILGTHSTIDNLRDHIFNGKIWPNYGSEGNKPVLNRYHYVRLPFHKKMQIPNTSMSVQAYPLIHAPLCPSTAFLIEHQDRYFLYFGDTTADTPENNKPIEQIWKLIIPLLKEKKLKGISLECSFPYNKDAPDLCGHLDTYLMKQAFHRLAELSKTSLEGFKVMVSHRKESIYSGRDVKEQIAEELAKNNDLGLHFIVPNQGDKILF